MKNRDRKTPAELGAWIKELREKQGLTIEEFGARAQIAPHNITKLERGEHVPGFSTRWALAEASGISLEEFFGGKRREASDPVHEAIRAYEEAPEEMQKAICSMLKACSMPAGKSVRRKERKHASML